VRENEMCEVQAGSQMDGGDRSWALKTSNQ
jgi:hypothetical protein